MQGLEAEDTNMTNTTVNSANGWVCTVDVASLLGPYWPLQPHPPAPKAQTLGSTSPSFLDFPKGSLPSPLPACVHAVPSVQNALRYQTASPFDIISGMSNSRTLAWPHLPPSGWNRSPSLLCSHDLGLSVTTPFSHIICFICLSWSDH